ncbi:hypothetical protein BGAL_0015g00130 [Botrytis galanthina]|uniref:Uncharacterized protein n=1 Tax=Botrytis galanthina TaxID=278940 RepID=A0A4S8RB96_9HELO|nr:hypothetical protein BGAL_0015g00130 [Botrytis galanthina]
MFSRRRWDNSMTAMLSGLRRIWRLLQGLQTAIDRRIRCNSRRIGEEKNRCGYTRGLGIEARLDSEVADDRNSQLKPMIMQISGMVSVVKDLAQ